MTKTTTQQTTLVLGGTGKTGRRVASRLEALGVATRIGSRNGTPAFDWNDPRTWSEVLRDVEALYIAYHPDLAVPGAADHIRRLAAQAVASGTKRIVLLSGRGEAGVLPSEQAVRESGADFTILRAAFFAQNFSEGMLHDAVLSGTVAFPAGSVAEPFLDVDDLADVAVAALTQEGHAGQTYELTGPRCLTFTEAVAELASATGRDLHYVPVSSAEYASALAAFVPAEFVAFLQQLFDEVLDGHNAFVADGVQRALGRAPRDFRTYAQRAHTANGGALLRPVSG